MSLSYKEKCSGLEMLIGALKEADAFMYPDCTLGEILDGGEAGYGKRVLVDDAKYCFPYIHASVVEQEIQKWLQNIECVEYEEDFSHVDGVYILPIYELLRKKFAELFRKFPKMISEKEIMETMADPDILEDIFCRMRSYFEKGEDVQSALDTYSVLYMKYPDIFREMIIAVIEDIRSDVEESRRVVKAFVKSRKK
jgi:hypothetical protein